VSFLYQNFYRALSEIYWEQFVASIDLEINGCSQTASKTVLVSWSWQKVSFISLVI